MKPSIKSGVLGRTEIRMYEDKCTQNFPPACTSTCPVHVDAKGISAAIFNQDFDKAKKIFSQSVIFPNIISKICDRPCEEKCLHREIGGTVEISALEKAAMVYGEIKNKKIRPFKNKEERVAIIGAGLAGLAAAMFLFEKGYQVTIYEKTDQLGGRIQIHKENGQLSQEEIDEDFALFQEGKIKIHFLCELMEEEVAELRKEFDGVYDTVYDPFALPQSGNYEEGRLKKDSLILQLALGRSAAITLDRQMNKVSLTEGREEGPYETKLFVALDDFTAEQSKLEGESNTITREAAVEEAGRCIQCACMECVKQCKFLETMKGYPKKYVREIANNLNVNVGLRQSKNMVNSCTFCGLCEKICPHGLHMGDVCMTAKIGLVNRNALPSTMHDFPIRDMIFSNSNYSSLWKHEKGKDQSKYLFFPGCQLAALQPVHIQKTYALLAQHLDGGVGLALGCCGAPAYWAGRTSQFDHEIGNIKAHWKEMGKPVILTGCSSCMKLFREEIEGAAVQSVWEIIDQHIDIGHIEEGKGKVSIHDACTAREAQDVQDAVRSLILKKGYEIEELVYSRDATKCCGYGGLVSFTNKELSAESIKARGEESEHPFVVYCAMCKDHFLSEGKASKHIFDLIFDEEERPETEKLTFSMRQENRMKLKELMLKQFWGETMNREKEVEEEIEFSFAEGIEKVTDQRLILKSDIQKVIYYGETTGNKMFNPKTGHYSAKLQPGLITYWVEYSIEEGQYLVHKAYSHRLELNKKITENASRAYTRSLSEKYKKDWE